MTMTLEEKNKLLQANYEKLVLQYNILDRNYKDLCKTQEALAQPAQEPVAWMRSALDNARDVCKYLDHDMIKEAKVHTKFFWNDIEKIKEPDTHPAPQPAQEPVAWMLFDVYGNGEYVPNDNNKFFTLQTTAKQKPIPLYTHPAPSWQGLESEKVTQIIHGLEDKLGMPIVGAIAVARAIEQALKEKNHVAH